MIHITSIPMLDHLGAEDLTTSSVLGAGYGSPDEAPCNSGARGKTLLDVKCTCIYFTSLSHLFVKTNKEPAKSMHGSANRVDIRYGASRFICPSYRSRKRHEENRLSEVLNDGSGVFMGLGLASKVTRYGLSSTQESAVRSSRASKSETHFSFSQGLENGRLNLIGVLVETHVLQHHD